MSVVILGEEELNFSFSVSLAKILFDLNLYFQYCLLNDFIFFETLFTLSGNSEGSPLDSDVSTFSPASVFLSKFMVIDNIFVENDFTEKTVLYLFHNQLYYCSTVTISFGFDLIRMDGMLVVLGRCP